MYKIISASPAVQLPPPVLFAPALTILKRPASAAASSRASSSAASRQGKTLQERERDYALARERIYGPVSTPNSSTPTSRNTSAEKLSLAGLGLDTQSSSMPVSLTASGAAGKRPVTPKTVAAPGVVNAAKPASATVAIRAPRGPPQEGATGFGQSAGEPTAGETTKPAGRGNRRKR